MKTLLSVILLPMMLFAQSIPSSYSNMGYNDQGKLFLNTVKGDTIYALTEEPKYTLERLMGNPKGSENGIAFDFQIPDMTGFLYYGFIDLEKSKHPTTIYFRSTAEIKEGKAQINIKKMDGVYDIVGWQKKGGGTIGYRVVNPKGEFLYDGVVSFRGAGPFEIDDTILEGPFVNTVTPDGATISFKTNLKIIAKVEIDGREFSDEQTCYQHEIRVSGLHANREYSYQALYGKNMQKYALRTAPEAGSRKSFVFAYASDSRSGRGGGERDFYGANFYIMKKIMALSAYKKSAFMQFTGDLVNGYVNYPASMHLQLASWKRSIEPFAHYLPVYTGLGNHETVMHTFPVPNSYGYSVDRFPFDSESTEAIFAANLVNPGNGPASEDGSPFDPDPDRRDFPGYGENVFFYSYDNAAMIVLNSNYWYASSLKGYPATSGNLHGYIMDNQLKWLEKTIADLELDKNIDHIFVTSHTPFFPNGGHVDDDMWYNGNNEPRAVVAGKAVEKGIIERRDQLLDILINKSKKVRAILAGDEHNYCRMRIAPDMVMYPEKYDKPKIKLSRSIWQLTNGAAGAPYYAQQQAPWTSFVEKFSAQHAVIYFHIKGQNIKIEVMNPDTLELIEECEL